MDKSMSEHPTQCKECSVTHRCSILSTLTPHHMHTCVEPFVFVFCLAFVSGVASPLGPSVARNSVPSLSQACLPFAGAPPASHHTAPMFCRSPAARCVLAAVVAASSRAVAAESLIRRGAEEAAPQSSEAVPKSVELGPLGPLPEPGTACAESNPLACAHSCRAALIILPTHRRDDVQQICYDFD